MDNNQLPQEETRSCLDCVHAKVWNYEGTYEDGINSGFECRQVRMWNEGDWVEPENYVTMTTEEFALYCARSCRDYERKQSESNAK